MNGKGRAIFHFQATTEFKSATVVAKREHWEVSAWKNRSPSGILPLEVVNCVLHREAVLPER
jgi:hypothetical protein